METDWMKPNASTLLPFVTRSAPWFDGKNKIYKYGGVYADPEVWPSLGFTIGKNKFWSLDTTTGQWQEEYPKGLGFYAGGVVYNRTDATFNEWGLNTTITPYFFLKTMLIYDMHTNEVRNTTIGLMQPFYGGSLQYVPVGNKGMLLLMGGIEEDSGVLLPRSFDHIYVYDIDTEKWFHQTAGGTIPDNRANFCTAVASAPDGSSHSIYMHGGAFQLTYADTYVLSVPAFQWVRIDDGANQQPRTRHSCHMTKQKQMWVVGGKPQAQEDPHAPNWTNGECFKNPLWNIFDVNTGEWQGNLVPITDEAVDYKVPKAVTDVIGGNEAGGATMRQPKDGWEESILDELWKEAPLPNATTTSAAPSASATAAKKGAAMKPIAEVSTLLASLVLTAVGMMFL
ncbi:hypothetical protein FN846DRAFT_47448 [Sphaerosporella brunnea]|uniref:Kelch repeat protein n=1 Tax=Sphaerosporella brunnea TaxID=1250544 RepID=A0A5J5EUF9_9PEZI|nr:hypothetical protein FN846DRAFT_47448 [Sphaerosporella brunnea]